MEGQEQLRLIATITAAAAILAIPAAAHSASDHRSKLRKTVHPCLAKIIDRENPGWDPRVWNRQGSGAYGLPQALPASKMASAGRDWRTNPKTQIRWMIRYVNSRYGGACQALAYHNRHGWY